MAWFIFRSGEVLLKKRGAAYGAPQTPPLPPKNEQKSGADKCFKAGPKTAAPKGFEFVDLRAAFTLL
ncbi:MAG: hypothetical protein LBR90_00630, partial [Elusimicrobiota bacterium]|nr:hypothetical protein [Elusimicrobiota bacterium]